MDVVCRPAVSTGELRNRSRDAGRAIRCRDDVRLTRLTSAAVGTTDPVMKDVAD
jgi:hypothetical protein